MRFTLACAALLMAATRALSAQIATPSALAGARCSYHARVIGAAFTDLAGILLAVATLRAVRDHGVQGSNIGLTLGGVALLGLSVPFQFGADGHLSRAVWWYNGTLGP